MATQSLFFEYGSQQAIHRDPWFVVTHPTYNLVAVWIALEDIHEDSGPLAYVPGSHRLPFYLTAGGNVILHDPRAAADDRDKSYEFMNSQIAARKLAVQTFAPRKGQALIWHYGLAHGGGPLKNPSLTRRSFVVHFDAADDRPRRGASIARLGRPPQQRYTTRKLCSTEGHQGFDNPLRVDDPHGGEIRAG